MAFPRLSPSNAGKTALLVCDIQQRFAGAITGFEHVVSATEKVLKAAKGLELAGVVVTEQNPRALGVTVPTLAQLVESEFDASKRLTLPKTKFSMVIPEVESWLRERQVEQVLLVGIEAHVCVFQTTLDLLSLDPPIQVHLLADAISSVNRGEVKLALRRLENAGAVVTSTESALFQLMGDAQHPHFKAIQGLIKDTKSSTKAALDVLVLEEGGPAAAGGQAQGKL